MTLTNGERYPVLMLRKSSLLCAVTAIASCGGSESPPRTPAPVLSAPGSSSSQPSQLVELFVGTAKREVRICPYESHRLKIVAKDGAGKHYETWDPDLRLAQEQQLAHSDFSWQANVGSIDKDGIWSFSDNAIELVDKTLELQATSRANPQLSARAALPFVFDCTAVVNLDGQPGRQGEAGTGGERGGDAPNLVIDLGEIDAGEGTFALAKLYPENRSWVRYYLLDRDKGDLQLSARGGNGGKGGEPVVLQVRGKVSADLAGRSGIGGSGGDGGNVTVRHSRKQLKLRKLVTIVNSGGEAGAVHEGGASVLNLTGVDPRFGRPGKAGKVEYVQKPVKQLFAEELAGGLRLR